MMELFSEIYGCYYSVVSSILKKAHEHGLSHREIDTIVTEKAFSESCIHLMTRLLDGQWDLLKKNDTRYYSKLNHPKTSLPLTNLQKAWLKALMADRRIRLFLDDTQIQQINKQFADIQPLFNTTDFHVFDAATDGDDYNSKEYIDNFRLIVNSIKQNNPLLAEYERSDERRVSIHFLPQRLLYSAKDDKFRVVAIRLSGKHRKQIILNMAKIQRLTTSDYQVSDVDSLLIQNSKHTVRIAISNERNGLERCMLQFASYDKETVYDEVLDQYLCNISYDAMEETELLIRILSFGPIVRVLGPKPFLKQVRERIRLQMERMA